MDCATELLVSNGEIFCLLCQDLVHNILLHVTSFFFKIWLGRFSWNSRAGSVRPFQTHTLRMSKYVIKVVLSCHILEATLPPRIVHNCCLFGATLANSQLPTLALFWRQDWTKVGPILRYIGGKSGQPTVGASLPPKGGNCEQFLAAKLPLKCGNLGQL